MKQWKTPVIEELNIQETAHGHGDGHNSGGDRHDNKHNDGRDNKPGNDIPNHTPEPPKGPSFDNPFEDWKS